MTSHLGLGLLSWLAPAAEPRLDPSGDPLPPGARTRLGTTRLRHGGKVIAVTFSPDGKTLASGGWDNTVRLWDAADGHERAALAGHNDAVWCLAFTRDGGLLSSDHGGKIYLWDLKTGKIAVRFEGHTGGVYKFALSPDGRTLYSGSFDRTVRAWDAATGVVRWQVDAGAEVHGLGLSPDGAVLAGGSNGGEVRLWDAATGEERLRF